MATTPATGGKKKEKIPTKTPVPRSKKKVIGPLKRESRKLGSRNY